MAAGCSSSGDSESNRPAGGGSHNGSGTGGKGAGTGGSDFGNGNGANGGTNSGTGGTPVMVMPVDPSAPSFMRDDTGMSGLPPDQIDMLRNGNGQCSLTVMYPYDGTMFAGGLEPPIIMWNSGADAAYVKFVYANSDKVSYEFAAGASNPGQIQIPRDAWNEITRRSPRTDLVVTLNVQSGGMVTSCPLHWRVAPGNMIGAIYYNTYQAPADLGGVADQGAVMRLSLGKTAEIYKQYTGAINAIPGTGPCYSCHSVSFNGTTLVASFHDYSLKAFHVEKYDVTADVQPTATGMLNNANFGALTPDGTRILAMGNPECTAGSDTFPRKPNNFPLVEGAAVARMLDTKSGNDLQAAGLDPMVYMWMPQFSPNGDMIVYNNAKPDGNNGTSRVELAVMDYDYASNTFSNPRVIVSAPSIPGTATPTNPYSPAPALGGVVACGADGCDGMNGNMCDPAGGDIPVVGGIPGIPGDVGALPMGSCTGPCYPAWPFFTPDGKAVIFSLTSEPDFANAFPGRDQPALSELWYVDLETGEIVRLDNANKGLQPQDSTANYYPTVMPIAVGGYFWVFWTAVRDYGTKIMGRGASMDLPNAGAEAIKKRIWVAAIKPKTVPMDEVTATPGPLTDPSLPGFYLAGQSESGNVRAFAALNPCLADGSSCTSGLDCCCGFCRTDDDGANGVCNCEPPKCSKLNEKCTTTADCCVLTDPDSPPAQCIGGFCGFIVLD